MVVTWLGMASYVRLSSWPAYEGRDRVNRARAREE